MLITFLYDVTTFWSVVGTVIPSILGFAIYICNTIIKIKQRGWKELNMSDWKEIGESIEREFNTMSTAIRNASCRCSNCNQKCQSIQSNMNQMEQQVDQAKSSLLQQTNIQVEKNVVIEKEKKFPYFKHRRFN